eukprot:14439-Amphidinium_carterae.1
MRSGLCDVRSVSVDHSLLPRLSGFSSKLIAFPAPFVQRANILTTVCLRSQCVVAWFALFVGSFQMILLCQHSWKARSSNPNTHTRKTHIFQRAGTRAWNEGSAHWHCNKKRTNNECPSRRSSSGDSTGGAGQLQVLRAGIY